MKRKLYIKKKIFGSIRSDFFSKNYKTNFWPKKISIFFKWNFFYHFLKLFCKVRAWISKCPKFSWKKAHVFTKTNFFLWFLALSKGTLQCWTPCSTYRVWLTGSKTRSWHKKPPCCPSHSRCRACMLPDGRPNPGQASNQESIQSVLIHILCQVTV